VSEKKKQELVSMLDGIRMQPMRKSASTKKYTVAGSDTTNKYDMYMKEDLRPLSNDGSLPNLTDFTNRDFKQKKKQVNWGKNAMKRSEQPPLPP
jgi:hypothetical protein